VIINYKYKPLGLYNTYYPLVMTNSSPWYRWPIEIDGLPIKNWWIFHGKLLNNQMVDVGTLFWRLPVEWSITSQATKKATGRAGALITPRNPTKILLIPSKIPWNQHQHHITKHPRNPMISPGEIQPGDLRYPGVKVKAGESPYDAAARLCKTRRDRPGRERTDRQGEWWLTLW